MTRFEKVTVTKENIDDIRAAIPYLDQREEVSIGRTISTWPITYDGGQRGQVTIIHNVNVGLIAFGGNSIWCWYDPETNTLIDDDNGIIYDAETGEQREAELTN